MATATVNPFEIAGRLTKAYRMAVVLRRAKISVAEARLQTQDEWAVTAKCAGYSHASEETQRICLEKLAELENPLYL